MPDTRGSKATVAELRRSTLSTPYDRRAGATRRRLIATALGGFGAVALAACGQPAATEPAGGSKDLPPAAVNFWHWGTVGADNYQDTFAEIAKRFTQASPKIKVETLMPPDYWNKMVAVLASDTPPDAFLINSTRNRQWFNQGTIKDVQNYLNKDKAAAADIKEVNKVFTDWYTVQGKLVGTPWDYSTIATVFNLDHLKAENLAPPAQLGDKWDWNLATEYAQKLTKKNASPRGWGFPAVASTETGWMNYVTANGGAMFSQDGKCTINSPQAQEATKFCVDLIQKSGYSPTRQQLSDLGGVIKGMQTGQLSITTNGDWNFKPLSDPSIPLSWDVSYMPRAPRTKKTASMANLRGISLTPGTKVPDQTWAFMAYTVRKEIQNLIPTMIQEVPARLDSALEVYADPQKAGPPPNRKALADSIKAISPLPAHDYAPITNLSDAWTPIMNDMWDGKVTVEEGLRRMQEEVQKVVDQFRR